MYIEGVWYNKNYFLNRTKGLKLISREGHIILKAICITDKAQKEEVEERVAGSEI